MFGPDCALRATVRSFYIGSCLLGPARDAGSSSILSFILPLNAALAQEVNRTSIIKQLWRAMDVRQGMLERNSFKMVYLYDDITSSRLRRRAEVLEGLVDSAQSFSGAPLVSK